MKTILGLLLSIACIAFGGCAAVSIGAASTRIEIKSPDRSASVVLPKNLHAVGPKLVFEPATGRVEFSATSIDTDAQSVIASASKSEMKAIQTIPAIVPLVTGSKP